MIRRVLVFLCILADLGTCGCGGGGGGSTGPPGFLYAVNHSTNDSHLETSCNDTGPTPTPLLQWDEKFASGYPDVNNTYIYWANKYGGSTDIYIYTGAFQGTQYASPFSNAIDAWYLKLNNDVHPGHYLKLNPVETYQYQGALVLGSFTDNSKDPGAAGAQQFGTINGQNVDISQNHRSAISGSNIVIAGSIVQYNPDVIQNPVYGVNNVASIYDLGLHEIGHALGLDHNSRIGSVMFWDETTRTDYGCVYNGQYPPAADTAQLENIYDPIFVDKNYGDGSGCKGSRCYQSKRRGDLAGSVTTNQHGGDAFSRLGRISHQPSASRADTFDRFATTAAIDARLRREGVERFMRSLRWVHGVADGAVDYRKLSTDSLALASSLVVKGHVTRVLSKSKPGPVASEYLEELQIDEVLSADRAVGETAKQGDKIVVKEHCAYEDVPFADDPLLERGKQVVMFLRPLDRHAAAVRGIRGRAYQFTAPLVSKWTEAADGRVYSRGDATARIARTINHRFASDIYRSFAASRSALSAGHSDEGSAARSTMLRARGMNPPEYVAAFVHDPTTALVMQARYDRTHY